MSRPVKNARLAASPPHASEGSKTPRRTGSPSVTKTAGTAKTGAGKYEKRVKQGKGDVVIWKDLPQ
jgi:hypothetical protein